jgi:hypothetical protein
MQIRVETSLPVAVNPAAGRSISLLHAPDPGWCENGDPAGLGRAKTRVWKRILAADARQPIPA